MARLDAHRIAAWRELQKLTKHLERTIDDELRADWDISLGWFDVLAALQRLGGSARPLELSDEMWARPSSLSRRLDRLAEEGWIARHAAPGEDGRAVEVELTRTGRRLWREMNVTYRRAVQASFAVHLDDGQIDGLHDVLEVLTLVHAEPDESDDDDSDI